MFELRKAKKAVLSYPKLLHFLDNNQEDKVLVEEFVAEMHGEYKRAWVKLSEKFIDFTFRHLYTDVRMDVPEGMDLRKLCEDNSVVLVPNHQSHADYVALTYLLKKKFKLPVMVAAGKNLSVLGLGSFLRRVGAFFIRRCFHGDQLYKYTLEAYIHYLLKEGKPLEFFFEGGRSRTGKLLSPRYGLFSLILEAHAEIKESKKPLLFIPVAMAHEYLPESKSHVRELHGGQKKQEHATQLIKLFRLFNKKMGTMHIRLSNGIRPEDSIEDLRERTQKLAIECFRAVGKALPVTPMSLLSFILLCEPEGALTWEEIEKKAEDIIDYCISFKVPLSNSLAQGNWKNSLHEGLNLTIRNKKVRRQEKVKLGKVFFIVEERARAELIYHKNMILQHFLVPCFIQATWPLVYNGEVKTNKELTTFLLQKRNELKYEFYLPSAKEVLGQSLKVLSYYLGKDVQFLKESLELTSDELLTVALRLRSFASALVHIYEGYFIAGKALFHLVAQEFTEEEFLAVSKEVFDMEYHYGRVVTFPESYSLVTMKNVLEFFLNTGVLFEQDGLYSVQKSIVLDEYIARFAKDLNDQIIVNFKTTQILRQQEKL